VYDDTDYYGGVLIDGNCDYSNTPKQQMDTAIDSFQTDMASEEAECEEYPLGSACDAMSTAFTCMTDAVSLGEDTYSISFSLPTSSYHDVAAFSGSLDTDSANWVASNEYENPTSDQLTSLSSDLNKIYNFVNDMSTSYSGCDPG